MKKNLISSIAEAARKNSFSYCIEDIECLTYQENGKTYLDRFDYIDTDGVHFICGTGYEDKVVPLEDLTMGSLWKLYGYINN